ncbi:hypothetical protein JCM3765_005810 [Sporobolomyces pararoseus]
MSFSSLPPELVHQIIESTVPHTFHSTTYKQRQQTLCSLSLVSRLFHSIAQPLLFEIVKLQPLSKIRRFSAARNAGVGGLRELQVGTLVICRDDTKDGDEAPEIIESLEVFARVRSITLGDLGNRALQRFLPMTSHHLTSLILSNCSWMESSERLFLPSLCSLSVLEIPRQLLVTLVDPQTVPNLRNFAFVDDSRARVEHLTRSKLDQLLPQLDTLNFTASIWLDPQAAFLHSAASRTLVDFTLDETERLDPTKAQVVHVRLEDSSLAGSVFTFVKLEAHLKKWSTLLRIYPSLSLKSIYLDSLLQLSESLPVTTSEALNSLVRVCQERKIAIVFESFPVDFGIDPFFSSEFIQRQKEHKRRETGRKVAV